MTVEFADGRKMTFKQGNGVLMSSGSIDGRFSPVMNVNTDLRGMYDRAVEKGCKTTLHSAPELDGKSFMDRYDELLTCDFVEYVAD